MENNSILSEAQALGGYLSACRRKLHGLAETGFKLPETLAFVKKELRAMGLEPKSCGKAGLTALIGSGEGKCFLLRADMDALPMAGDAGAAHSCGHDMHTAMLLGAARLLKNHEHELRGQVKLMFQPAEETLEGAKNMLEAGVLDSPAPDAALALHVMTASALHTGSVVLPEPGLSAPGADFFSIRVRGKGCHGATPNAGVDPLSAAAHIIIGLQELLARELGMDKRAALSIGALRGGEAANVIPDAVSLEGTLRAFGEETRSYMKSRLADIAGGIAASFRAEASVSFGSGCPGLLSDGGLVSRLGEYSRELLGANAVYKASDFSGAGGSAASEDFAYISRRVPSAMLALAAGEKAKGFVHPLHHPQADFDEAALAPGAALLAHSTLRWLEDECRPAKESKSKSKGSSRLFRALKITKASL